jgi:hypothetical protein
MPAPGGRWRVLLGAVALVIVLAAIVAVPATRSAGESFLSIFRVERFAAVSVNPTEIAIEPDATLNPAQFGRFEVVKSPQTQAISLNEALSLNSIRVVIPTYRPAGLSPDPELTISTETVATFKPDLPAVRAYLHALGGTDISLPDQLNGATITLSIPRNVTTSYPSAIALGTTGRDRGDLTLKQFESPSISVDNGVDLDQVRDELLKVPGLPPSLVAQLRAIDDWKHTMIVPVIDGTSRDVTINGAPGLLVQTNSGDANLVWQRDGMVYWLSGYFAEAELISVAESMS